MPTTATTAQEALSDSKVSGLLDDLIEDTDETIVTAKALRSSNALRHCSSSVLSAYERATGELDRVAQESEYERGEVLDGRSADLKKFKSLLQTQLDGIVNLQEQNGRFEALQDADIGAIIVAIIAVLHELSAPASEMGRLQRELESIRTKLQAAIKRARNTKVKAAVMAGFTAAGTVLAPVGMAATGSVFVGKLVVGQVMDAALQGREESNVKQVWTYAGGLSKIAVALGGAPKAMGPLTDIVSGAVDIGECFAAERDKQALVDQLKKFMADFKKAAAAFIAASDKIGKSAADAEAKLKKAIAAVNAFKPTKGSYHAVLGMI